MPCRVSSQTQKGAVVLKWCCQVRLAKKAGALRGFHRRIDRTREVRLEKGNCESNLVGRA